MPSKLQKVVEIMYRNFFKRLIDIIISITGLILTAVIMLVVALAVKIESPGEVIFRQKRREILC